jgi:H+/Cl- antiporter ClcA
MADLADMAMASLGNDTNGYDVYGANPTTAAQHTNTNMSAAARRSMAMQHTPNSHPLAAGVGGYDSIPETESAPTRRSPADNVSHRYSQGSTRDNVRVSEISQGARDSRGSIFSILSDESQNLYGTNLSGLEDSANFQPSPRSEGGPPAPPPYPTQYGSVPVQQREIDMFSSLVQGDFAGTDTGATKEAQVRALPPRPKQADRGWFRRDSSSEFSDDDAGSKPYGEDDQSLATILYDQVTDVLDPTAWLSRNVKFDEDGTPFFDDLSAWTIAGFVRHYLYNPCSPEFTSLQQFSWAVILGILMGFYTAAWKMIIEKGLDFMWKSVPEKLLEIGVFTELDGYFPMYHYMWMTPGKSIPVCNQLNFLVHRTYLLLFCVALFGGVLSYIFVILPVPIPDQNEWINNIHSRGVQDYRTFWTLFFLSTAGMLSGLSLGPELPLVLTAGMLGSRLGLICKQSMLQARVMNLTAASAAVGGFFGFPMAGALFVLEIPHRMGLQYFEALSPATIASIVAVLCNRMVTGNEVTGYYSYPFLTASLPSEIFTSAVFYGFFGAAVGIIYAKGVVVLKTLVHDLFHATHDDHDDASVEPAHSVGADVGDLSEVIPLVGKNKAGKANAAASKSPNPGVMTSLRKYLCCVIPSEPNRAAVAGTLAGAIVGIIGIYVPHSMFWGEAQLQSLIDKGRTPLPVFGQGDEPTAALVALGRCMIDPTDGAAVRAGFSIECALVISVAKIVTTGLSLGTGIIAGHFWGPLFVGRCCIVFASYYRLLLAYPMLTICASLFTLQVAL